MSNQYVKHIAKLEEPEIEKLMKIAVPNSFFLYLYLVPVHRKAGICHLRMYSPFLERNTSESDNFEKDVIRYGCICR